MRFRLQTSPRANACEIPAILPIHTSRGSREFQSVCCVALSVSTAPFRNQAGSMRSAGGSRFFPLTNDAMQDRYVGDVGDFGKFGLLRALCGESHPLPLKLGVVWYRFPMNRITRMENTPDTSRIQ